MSIITYLALAVTFFIIAAIFNAAMDKLQFHYSQSIFARLDAKFWNPAISWRNKWRNGRKSDGEKFWGSSRWFVSLTDGWHLMQKGMTAAMAVIPSVGLLYVLNVPLSAGWHWALLLWVGVQVAWGATFELFFGRFFEHRK